MPESGDPDPEILQRVIDMIHEMEFSGRAIPERITLKVWLFEEMIFRCCVKKKLYYDFL